MMACFNKHSLPAFILSLVLILLPRPGSADIENFEIENVRSTYIRAALFDMYQGKHASAIGQLMAERWRNLKDKERVQAELLLAYLYVQYRMHDEAEKILNALPKKLSSSAKNNKNILWMEIAKSYFRAGDIRTAQNTLYKLDKVISNILSREREVFIAQILMSQNKYQEAIEELEKSRGSSDWAAFGRYNLGVMLIRAGNEDRGLSKLETVARMSPSTQEMKALKDKANYTIGYLQLKNKNPEKAKKYLQRVRLKSPLANKSLMYLGLVYSDLEKHKLSLAAWLELSERDKSDSTVLESMLAVPFAYAELGGFKQAAANYKTAIKIYKEETKRINKAIRSAKKGKTTNAILDYFSKQQLAIINNTNASQKTQNNNTTPLTSEARYLLGLYESNEFQAAITNYFELIKLEQKLKKWTTSIYRVQNMSKTFKKVYVDKIAEKQSRLTVATEEIKQHISKLALAELRERKSSLQAYIKQAQFATAQIYDKSRSNLDQ